MNKIHIIRSIGGSLAKAGEKKRGRPQNQWGSLKWN